MTKNTNTKQELELVTFNKELKATENAVAITFDPREVRRSLEKTKAHILSATLAHQQLNLAEYRVLYNAYVDKMYMHDFYVTSKGEMVNYDDFIKWAKDKMNVGRSNAYAAAQVGKYITEDATGTVLYKYGKGDYSFNALVTIFQNKNMYEGKGKERHIKIVPLSQAVRDERGYIVWETSYNDKGLPIAAERKLVPVLDEKGNQVHGTIVDMLAMCGIINQNMSIPELKKALNAYFNPTADETTADETTADETTADETTADETTADETTADEFVKISKSDIAEWLELCKNGEIDTLIEELGKIN